MHSLLCLPAVALPLLIGVPLGYPGTAVLMAGGAQTVGFGSFQQPLYTRSGPMAIATVGIAISAMVGALCRDSTPALLAAVLVWSVVYGLSNGISSAMAWVGQQCCVFLIVSSAAASTPGTTHDLVKSAMLRGLGVLAGGALQTVCIFVGQRVWPQARTHFTKLDFDPKRLQVPFLREQLNPHSGTFVFTLRVTLTSLLATVVYRHLNFPNAYWIGMTAVLVPKPEWTLTAARSVLRTAGTLLGALISTLLVVSAHPHGLALTALVIVFLFLSYLWTNVNYGAFSVVLTGYICFLLAIVRQPAHSVLEHRMGATAAGCGIAVGVHLVVLGLRKAGHFTVDRVHTLEERFGWRSVPAEESMH
ncbi:FUSC family protein [Terriglobus aquaticus]|uniref:FUSC family protein n=1 Tax=Terriglobus aquaticus TaxID=940139 RepID=A0ABW9KFX8_9BACT|nr:FUSC family protein [Terriglobus aquaticus]